MPGIALVPLVMGAVLLSLGLLMAAGRLRRSWGVGFRTTSLMASDEAWLIGHKAIAAPLIAIGALNLVAGVLMLVLTGRPGPFDDVMYSRGLAVTYQVGLVVMVVLLAIRADMAARAVTRGSGHPGEE